jgi:mRNA interferase RelE/StbE
MIVYALDFSVEGKTALASIDKKIAQSILNKLKWLVQNAENIDHIPLERELAGLYKLRVGNWRVLYELNHTKKTITVHNIGHRKEIYR